jgi:hypothetical protein
MTDISVTSPVERIARVIAAAALSPNGEGPDWSERGAVSDQVDSVWRQEVDRAVAILKTLREPTPEMVDAGHAAGSKPAEIWNAMVRAALDQHADEMAG